MRSGQAGVTLIELMIAVAIVGILAGIAVYAYSNSTAKARVSEVHALFAEFRIRQEQYQAENGTYLSTGASETDYHPSAPSSTGAPIPLGPLPTAWEDLRMQPDKSNVHCAYVSIAGLGGDSSNIGAVANSFGMATAPATNWFYVIAKCDFDGDGTDFSMYFTRSDVSGIAVTDEGE